MIYDPKDEMSYSVAIAGATGAVGAELIKLLETRNFPVSSLKLLASPRSVGKELTFKGEKIKVELLEPSSFEGVDYAFFSAGGGISKEMAPEAVKRGCVVIDNSSAFRYVDDVPLVVPEINPEDAKAHKGIIANPNCTTIVTLMAVAPLHREFGLKRLITSSYQSISGAGASAMAELEQQARDWSAGKELTIETQAHQILFNLYPHIDAFQDNAFTKEEMKMLWEGRKILHHETLRAASTCVRVPVLRCHSISINAEFEKPVTPDQAREVIAAAQGVVVMDDVANNVYPMPLDRAGIDEVAVGRIREDISCEGNGLVLWAVGDQIGKGAALNAVQIAELLVK